MEAISPDILNRKGPRKVDEVLPEVKSLLEAGRLQTANLTEWLAVNQVQLISQVFPALDLSQHILPLSERMQSVKKPTAMKMVKLVGESLKEWASSPQEAEDWQYRLKSHTSDIVRSYAPYLIMMNPGGKLDSYLEEFLPYAADEHFGVREIAWMAARPMVDTQLEPAITALAKWTSDEDENVRRFSTEVSRPRGVWCKHIHRLKEQPELARPILDPLRADPAKYVQDSVGNWLNDAAKSCPDFVISITDEWQQGSNSKHTQRIIRKARRSIKE